MSKPTTFGLYSADITGDCERVLVTLLSGLGPWKKSFFLVGGLAPRYIVKARPPAVPPHAGTGDVDIVVDMAVLADTEAYQTLEQNLKRMGFERGENERGDKVNWRWKTKTEHGVTMVLEFLAYDPELGGGKLQELPTKGNISAVNIPHASIVFDLHDTKEVTAELLGGNGRATETVAYANLVSFTCLKAFAFEHRRERKDAHDLVYCLEHVDGGTEAAAAIFAEAMVGPHAEVIGEALMILARRFTDPVADEGYLRESPVAVAKFEVDGEEADQDVRQQRALRQRDVNALIRRFLAGLEVDVAGAHGLMTDDRFHHPPELISQAESTLLRAIAPTFVGCLLEQNPTSGKASQFQGQDRKFSASTLGFPSRPAASLSRP